MKGWGWGWGGRGEAGAGEGMGEWAASPRRAHAAAAQELLQRFAARTQGVSLPSAAAGRATHT